MRRPAFERRMVEISAWADRAAPYPIPSERQAVDTPRSDALSVLIAAGHAPTSPPDLTTAPGADRANALQRGSVPAAELVSATAGFLGDRGPPT